jgi:ribosomal protein S27E
MATDLSLDPFEDEPTERFLLQTCPLCRGVTLVSLAEAEVTCDACKASFAVAPLTT